MKSYLMINTTVANPVLTPEFAATISKNVNVSKFDIHVHLEDMFAGTSQAFIAEMYNRIAWRLDAQLKNSLRQVARELPRHEGVNSIDNYSEVTNALDELWNKEEHGFEVGFEGTGPLHMITAIRNVREAWHNKAQIAETGRGRTYSVMTIESQIASPNKASITSAQIANFEFEALKLVGGLSDVALRRHFRDGINYNEQLESIERVKRDRNPSATDEQIMMWLEQDDEFKSILAARAKLPSTAIRALNHRTLLIQNQEALHEQWYEAEVKLVGLQLQVYDYCTQHMLAVDEHQVEFCDLPDALQTIVCGDAIAALDKTLSKFSSKSPTLYCTYSLIVDEAKSLLNRVIAARLGDNDYAVTETDVDAAIARSNMRRAAHRKADESSEAHDARRIAAAK